MKISALLAISSLAITLPLLPELVSLLVGAVTAIIAVIRWFMERKTK